MEGGRSRVIGGGLHVELQGGELVGGGFDGHDYEERLEWVILGGGVVGGKGGKAEVGW